MPNSNSAIDSEYVLLTGGHVIDETGNNPIADGGVLGKGGRIVEVGPQETLEYPESETTVLDLGDRTIMLGLINAHTHITIYIHRTRGRFRLIDPRNTLAYNTIRALESGSKNDLDDWDAGRAWHSEAIGTRRNKHSPTCQKEATSSIFPRFMEYKLIRNGSRIMWQKWGQWSHTRSLDRNWSRRKLSQRNKTG